MSSPGAASVPPSPPAAASGGAAASPAPRYSASLPPRPPRPSAGAEASLGEAERSNGGASPPPPAGAPTPPVAPPAFATPTPAGRAPPQARGTACASACLGRFLGQNERQNRSVFSALKSASNRLAGAAQASRPSASSQAAPEQRRLEHVQAVLGYTRRGRLAAALALGLAVAASHARPHLLPTSLPSAPPVRAPRDSLRAPRASAARIATASRRDATRTRPLLALTLPGSRACSRLASSSFSSPASWPRCWLPRCCCRAAPATRSAARGRARAETPDGCQCSASLRRSSPLRDARSPCCAPASALPSRWRTTPHCSCSRFCWPALPPLPPHRRSQQLEPVAKPRPHFLTCACSHENDERTRPRTFRAASLHLSSHHHHQFIIAARWSACFRSAAGRLIWQPNSAPIDPHAHACAHPRRMGATSALPPARALSISGLSLPFSARMRRKLKMKGM